MEESDSNVKDDSRKESDSNIKDDSGWNQEITGGISSYKLIKLANQKFPLTAVFKEQKIFFQDHFNSNGWDKKRTCPFPDHQDNSPSFYYNSQKDFFHCFGCQRNGKTVQFLSALKAKSQIDIANELLSGKAAIENISFVEIINPTKEINQILIKYADFHSNFMKTTTKASQKYANNLMFVLEAYVKNHLVQGDISLPELQARVNFCLNKLKELNGT